MFPLRVCTVLLFACRSILAGAQFFTNQGPADGLSNEHATRLFQDTKGYLWVATREGLNRSDGAHLRTYLHAPTDPWSIPHGHVERMHQGADGRIWLTSGNGGLAVYLPDLDRFMTWEMLTGARDPAQGVATRAVHAHTSDSIYVGVFGQGLWLYRPSLAHAEQVAGPRGLVAFTAEQVIPHPPDPHLLMVRMGDRVMRLDTRDHAMEELIPPLTGLNGKPAIMHTIRQVEDTLWVGTWGSGLWRCPMADGTCVRYLPEPLPPLTGAKNIITSILQGEDGHMLVGTERGLLRFDTDRGTFQAIPRDPQDPNALPDGAVLDLLKTRDGTIWIARSTGLSRWDPAQDRFQTRRLLNRVERSVPLPNVTGVVELEGRLLLGTVHGDGFLLEQADGTFQEHPFPELATEGYAAVQVWNMARTGTGQVVACTGKGIFSVEGPGVALKPMLPLTFKAHGPMGRLAFVEDRHGHWWVGSQRKGVYQVDPVRDRAVLFGADGPEHRRLSSSIWCQGVAEDAAGHIWVSAYEEGIDRVRPDRQRVDQFRYSAHPWLRTGKVWDILVDAQDRLWLATNGQGIIITPAADPGGEGTLQLLGGSSPVTSLISTLHIDDDGLVWAGGPSGLFRIDPVTMEARRFDRSEGLRRTDLHHASIAQHPSGRITINARVGELIVLDDKTLDGSPGSYGISVQEILVNGRPVRTDTAADAVRQVVLAPGEDHLEVAFGAIAHSMRDRVRIGHQLMGLDEVLHTAGPDGRAVHSRIPPGSYRFELRDATHGALDAPLLHAMAVVVRPHFHQTFWFRAGMGLLALLLVTGLLYWRFATQRERYRLESEHKRRLGEMEMQALRAQMNPHFLFNSLNSINRFIIRNDARTASEYLTKFSRLVRGVLHNSKERLVPLKDELDALRLYVELEALRFSDGFRYEAVIQLDEDPATVMVPPMLLQPYVENAIWHGLMHKKTGDRLLVMRAKKDNGTLEFEVEDNGIGRAEAMKLGSRSATKQGSMGMRITRERLDLVRTMYDLDTSVQVIDLYDLQQHPAGTKVVIRISERKP